MKKTPWILACFLGLALASCGQESPVSSETPSDDSGSSIQSESSSSSEGYRVILLETGPGFKVTLSSLTPAAGETVLVDVESLFPNSRRLESVTMNGKALDGQRTTNPSITRFAFRMPEGKDAEIAVQGVDVYAVRPADQRLVLGDVGDGLYAAGESVSFRPATVAGYYYKNIHLSDPTIELQESGGVYSFSMPSSEVMVLCDFGLLEYSVTYEKSDRYSISFPSGSTFAYQDTVAFEVLPVRDQFEVRSVEVDGNVLTGRDGLYSFSMPAYPVEISVSLLVHSLEVSLVPSAHFGGELFLDQNGTLVPVGSSEIYAGDRLVLQTSALEGVDASGYEAKGIALQGKESDGSYVSVDVDVALEGDGAFAFRLPETHSAYRVSILEGEALQVPQGNYAGESVSKSGSRLSLVVSPESSSYGDYSDVTFLEREDGAFSMHAASGSIGLNNTLFFDESGTFVVDHQISSSFDWGGGTAPMVTNVSPKNAIGLLSKVALTSTSALLMVDPDLSGDEQYLSAVLTFEMAAETKNAYLDFLTDSIVWDVDVVSEGSAAGSLVTVSKDGTVLASMTRNSTAKTYHQSYANVVR